MKDKWIRISARVDESIADDAAAALAFDTGRAVEVGPARDGMAHLGVWFRDGEGDVSSLLALVDSSLAAQAPPNLVGKSSAALENGRDWLDLWKKSFKHLTAGERLLIVPSWEKNRPGAERIPVIIDPGMAFGTGHHATTAACLAMLEKHIGQSVLDVGCGSGILSIAAARLGARRVVGVDTDPEAVAVARQNVKINEVADRVEILEGSAGSIEGVFDLTVANIFLNTILELAQVLRDRTAPGGALIASGLREDQAGKAGAALRGSGFAPEDEIVSSGWATLVYRKNP